MSVKRLYLMVLVLLAACGGRSDDTVVTSDFQDLPADRVLYGTTFNTTVEGIRRAVQQSDSMYVEEDSTVAQLFGVRLLMYDTLGHRTADLRSKQGRFDQRTQKMIARGNVVLVLADGRQVLTEELNYDPESHRIWSDVPTRLRERDGSTSSFQTFTTDDQFRNMTGTGMRGKVPGLRL